MLRLDDASASYQGLPASLQGVSLHVSRGEINRALMTRPRFLMLDEPSQGIMPRW
jgi:ABC-type lipopolysaccharide export system ATPase subunit